jgi:hypothetical protein
MVAASVVDHRDGGENRFGQLFLLVERFFALWGRGLDKYLQDADWGISTAGNYGAF